MAGKPVRSSSLLAGDLNLPKGAQDFCGSRESGGIRHDPLRIQFAVAVRDEDAYPVEPHGAKGLAPEKRALRMPRGVGGGDQGGRKLFRRSGRSFGVNGEDNGFAFGEVCRPRG